MKTGIYFSGRVGTGRLSVDPRRTGVESDFPWSLVESFGVREV